MEFVFISRYEAIVFDKTLKETRVNMRKGEKIRNINIYRQYNYQK